MYRINSPRYTQDPSCVLILAHGAGAPMDSSFMETLAGALDQQGVACVRFEFPYMARRRSDGRKRPPDRQPVLLEQFGDILREVRSELGPGLPVLVGGKSMGGRMASLLVTDPDLQADGVACFGYPFHLPGKPDKWRVEHFPELRCPLLIVQGTRDPFGKAQEVEAKGGIDGVSQWQWLEGGNHDFQPLKKQPETQQQLIEQAARATRTFIDQQVAAQSTATGVEEQCSRSC
ncbi:hypothetical protein SAMN05216429_10550 [Marinobacter persicus]|uniref:KANL3/Tex30 alpha/beta hydrolase-like domain-containing protein n=1 Tax=Marinobacter persicus TaxID=930118 RepID=A0A1I3TJF5_9GAMM|nr:alpha/beta family hydrolase [Marinobacter persicus]GHD46306.1 hypothetical protein GCM10008110_13100 [Marinobacter persicus]SFJ71354.1 hypothetical protein SAMN05216429_10550 [Marinobacter persicus]